MVSSCEYNTHMFDKCLLNGGGNSWGLVAPESNHGFSWLRKHWATWVRITLQNGLQGMKESPQIQTCLCSLSSEEYQRSLSWNKGSVGGPRAAWKPGWGGVGGKKETVGTSICNYFYLATAGGAKSVSTGHMQEEWQSCPSPETSPCSPAKVAIRVLLSALSLMRGELR